MKKLIIPITLLIFTSCKTQDLKTENMIRPSKSPKKERYEMTTINIEDKRLLVKTFETTQREWISVMGENPSFFTECGLNCPVERVNIYDVLTFLNNISRAEKLQECYNLNQCTETHEKHCADDKYGCFNGKTCKEMKFNNECNGYRLITKSEWNSIHQLAYKDGHKTYEYSIIDNRQRYVENIGLVDNYGRSCDKHIPFFSGEIKEEVDYCGLYEVKTRSKDKNNLYDFIGNVKEWVWLDGESEKQMTNGCSWTTIDCLKNLEHESFNDLKMFDVGFRFVKNINSQNPQHR